MIQRHHRRNARIDRRDCLRFVVQDGRQGVGHRVAAERMMPCRHLVKQRAERKLIGAKVAGGAARLLGTHVGGRAADTASSER